jgi:hypothetical protein
VVEFIATSGAKVKINPAPFGAAISLKSALARELSAAKVDISIDLLNGMQKDINLVDFAKVALIVDSSDAVMDRLFDCLIRCSYNGEKITPGTFEDVDARQDYYEIMIACLKENLSPFFKSLISKLQPFLARINQAQLLAVKTPE